MTTIHILNFLIPITCIIVIGISLDKMCQPDTQKKHEEKK